MYSSSTRRISARSLSIGRPWRPVDPRACHPEQRALPADRGRRRVAIDERPTVRRAHLPDSWLKSRSTVSCPILACSFSISRSRSASASRPTPGSKARPPAPEAASSRHRSGSGELHQHLRRVCHSRLLPQRLQGYPRLQRCIDLPSRLLHHPLCLPRRNGATYPTTAHGPPKSGVHFTRRNSRFRLWLLERP